VISDSSDAVVATVTLPPGSSPYGVAYDPAKGEVFVANYGYITVSVISDAASSSATTPSSTTTTATSTGGQSSTTTQAPASSSTTGGGGVPEFPYQFAIATVFTLLLAASYLLVRRRSALGGRAGL
jgi:DNA-binding beta-propeller fold protein YncE